MKNLIVVGTGAAYEKHYAAPLKAQSMWRVLGFVDPNPAASPNAQTQPYTWQVDQLSKVPSFDRGDVLLILTPDHYAVIEECARRGYRRFIVEKPLVSRDEEVEKLAELVRAHGLKIYAIDFYIHKLFGLCRVLGVISPDDPRAQFVQTSAAISENLLGDIEGVAVSIIEAGNFCLPDLATRPWLEHDREIGGMLRDLGTHAFAPLIAARLIGREAAIHAVHFAKIAPDRKTLVRTKLDDVEMYAHALLSGVGSIPIAVTVGKVPLSGGVWSITVRGSKGNFHGSLRSGQGSVFIGNDGTLVTFALKGGSIPVVLEEASMYFDDQLGEHDGYVSTLIDSLSILSRLRAEGSEMFPRWRQY